MQRWRPDTCGCIILEESGTSAYNSHEFVCPQHQGLTQIQLETIPHNDNFRKNDTEKIFKENLQSTLMTTNPEGNLVYKNGITFNFSYSGTGSNRVLTVTYTGVNLTTNQKNTIQGICDTQFGVGKVVIG